MSRLRLNIIANYAGSGWAALLSLVLVPFYLRILGAEAYGLVGFFVSLRAVVGILDLGLSTATSREVAARSAQTGKSQAVTSLVRSIEIVYWLIGVVLAIAMFAVSDVIATQWVKSEYLAPDTVRLAIGIFGVTLATSWPVSLYKGVMRGLERQVAHNAIVVVTSTIRGVGAIVALLTIAPSITVFLVWQLVASVIEVVVMRTGAWRMLQKVAGRITPHFDVKEIRSIWKYAAGVSGVSVLAIIISQLDKVYISKLLPLSQLGYYTAAASLASAIGLFVGPIVAGIFPRLTSTFSTQNFQSLATTYHRSAKVISFLVAPVGMILALFSHDALLLWTRSAAVADNGYLALSFLAIGGVMSAIAVMPYSLQLAAGLTWMPFLINLVTVVALIPTAYVAVTRWGIAGAAFSIALSNILYYLITPHMMHRYVLQGHKSRWIFQDTLPFVAFSFVIFGGIWTLGRLVAIPGILLVILVLCGAVVYYATSYVRYKDVVDKSFRSLLAKRQIT